MDFHRLMSHWFSSSSTQCDRSSVKNKMGAEWWPTTRWAIPLWVSTLHRLKTMSLVGHLTVWLIRAAFTPPLKGLSVETRSLKLTVSALLSAVCKDQPGDLFFLIDSSRSIGQQDYQKMKDFMKSVISKSVVGEQDVRMGVMQYSTLQRLEFPLNRYYTKDELSKAIDGIQHMDQNTHTGEAISAVSRYFDADMGGRPHFRQRLVVITDGESQDEVKKPAKSVRDKGVVVYAIGVVNANTTQLLEISGTQERMYAERDFDALKDLESKVALELCEPERGRKQKHFDLFNGNPICLPFLTLLKCTHIQHVRVRTFLCMNGRLR